MELEAGGMEALPLPGMQALPRPGTPGTELEVEEALPRPGTPGTELEVEEVLPRPGTELEVEEALPRPGTPGTELAVEEALPRPGTELEVEEALPLPGTPGTELEVEEARPRPGTELEVEEALPRPGNELEPEWRKRSGPERQAGKREVVEVEKVMIVKRTHRNGSGSTPPVIDVLMKHGDEPPAALLTRICAAASPLEQTSGWSTALVRERIARDLIQTVLAAVSRTPIGEDLMYEFGTWAFTSGRRAMQNDVQAALEVSIDEDDLLKILAVLLEDVPDPEPTPFSKISDERASGSAAGAFAGRRRPRLTERRTNCRGAHTSLAERSKYLNGPKTTWAFTSGRRAMQNDVRAALEVSIDEDDLLKILAVLLEDVPDPEPTPFSKISDERASGSAAEASAGPTAEAAAHRAPD
nr:Small proline-rich protein 3 [Ipomoea batatas]